MLSQLTGRQGEYAASQSRHADYRRTLVAPLDGMWESTTIAAAMIWDIYDDEQYAGYFLLGADQTLLRFYLTANYQGQAQAIFGWVVATYAINQAVASTLEPCYFALCLDRQLSVTVLSYLFHDHDRLAPSRDRPHGVFRQAERGELADITRFYRANIPGSQTWVDAFLRERSEREELFVLLEQQTLLATGECIPSQLQPPYADLGMVVAQNQRGKGIGSAMLLHLKQHCYAADWQPICSCAADNPASKRAIEKAGFISEHRMVEMRFSSKVGD